MTLIERHRYILERLAHDGQVRVVDLSEALHVSTVTIRKDLKQLEAKQLLHRSHGMASSKALYVHDRPVQEKAPLFAAEKLRIAEAACRQLAADDALIIGSGTTALAFAHQIPRELPLRVLTSALNVAMALVNHPQIELVQLGGVVRRSSTSAVGPFAEEMMRHFACTKLFLGVDGLTVDYGLTTSNMMEAHLNELMMKAAQQTIVLADASKFGRKGFGRICPVEEVDMIITDESLPKGLQLELVSLGIELELC